MEGACVGLRNHRRNAMQTVSTITPSTPPTPATTTVDAKPMADRPALLDDPRSKRILAKTIYRELKESGAGERDVLAIATELLALVAADLRDA